MLNKGDFLKVTTKTLHDVFGICYYEVFEVGLKAPEKGREEVMDGVKCVMIGGSGPAARLGFVVIDSQMKIAEDIARGVTEIVSKDKVNSLVTMHKGTGISPNVPGEGKPRPIKWLSGDLI